MGRRFAQIYADILNHKNFLGLKNDEFVKTLLGRLPGESRGPERLEITGFPLSLE
jgi:hypothetical protein